MSALLKVERLNVERWGRASGFDLVLPEGNFVVLYGPNESGKTSVATALAWLIAGPGPQGVLQRFGNDKEVLRVRLRGRLGSDPLIVEVSAKVTAQRPGTAAREATFRATLGGTRLSRQEQTGRLGGGDFTGYQRHYWVEALKVAEGDDLQENVSVQAMFGGVNPFSKADGLDAMARSYLGASRGTAAEGSARKLHDQVRDLDGKLRGLPDTKGAWARIDREITAKTAVLRAIQPAIDTLEVEIRSVELAATAFGDGLVAARDAVREALAATPEPSPADRHVHEQASLVRRKIGDLGAAEGQWVSIQKQYETAQADLDGDWRSLIDGGSLGEAGISDATEAEAHLKVCRRDLANAQEEEACAKLLHRSWQARYDELFEKWSKDAPETLSPESCVSLAAGSDSADGPIGAATGTPRSSVARATRLRRHEAVVPVLGTTIVIAAAVLSAVQGNWTAVVLAGVGAVALGRLAVNSVRSRSTLVEAPAPALVDLAKRLLEDRGKRNDAAGRLTSAVGELARHGQRTEDARREYRRKLTSLGVSEQLAERFEGDVAKRLEVVRKIQLSAAELRRKREAVSERLCEVQGLLAGAGEQAGIAAPKGSTDVAKSALVVEAPAGEEDGDGLTPEGVVPPTGPGDAAEAGSALEVACQRVDRFSDAVVAVEKAEDALDRALHFDEGALTLIEESSLEELRVRCTELENQRGGLAADRDDVQDQIAGLAADKQRVEDPDNQRVDIVLQRSELLAHVEDGLVRGLGHHLAARLLREAAEQHRKTQQPKLLRRTQELACDVADDWRGITVNPHASTARGTSGPSDNLLVDSSRGEFSAECLSSGAQSLLYLTLRLATVEEQSRTRGVRLPLLLDDVLVGLDDERAERCLYVLSRFSESHQLVLLTCHQSTAERAQAAGAEIREMPSP